MIILKHILTNKQKLYRKEPTQLDVLREINKRNGLDHNKELQDDLARLERGLAGEEILIDYLRKHGEEDWVFLRNIWFDYFGKFESDILLITEAEMHTFEVKNFSGIFELKNNLGTINDIEMGKHPISQAQKAMISLNGMFKYSAPSPNIIGNVLFASADNQVKIHDSKSKINIVKRDRLQEYIWEISQTERNYQRKRIDIYKVLNVLNKHEIRNQFPAKELFLKLENHIQPGITCCYCGGFNPKITKSYIICDCGMHEPRDEAIVRTICEYGIMNFNKDLTTTELTVFFNKQISRSNVSKILNQYFEKTGSYKNSRFTNKQMILQEDYNNFGFTAPKYMVINGRIDQLKNL